MHKLGEVMQVASENDDRRGAGSSFARHLHHGGCKLLSPLSMPGEPLYDTSLKHRRAPTCARWPARSNAGWSGHGHRNIGKDRPGTSHGDGLARKFGNYDATGPPSRERSKGKQGECRDAPRRNGEAGLLL